MGLKKVKTYKVKNKNTELTHTVPEWHFSLNDEVNYQIIGKKPDKAPEGDEGGEGPNDGNDGDSTE